MGAEFKRHVSLVLSERVLPEGQNHLFPDDKISELRNCLREDFMSVDTCRDSISRFFSGREEYISKCYKTLWFLVY